MRNVSSNFAHQELTKILHQYGWIFVEDITSNEFVRNNLDFFLLWTSAEDAAVLMDVCLSVLWNGKEAGSQRPLKNFETWLKSRDYLLEAPLYNRFTSLVAGQSRFGEQLVSNDDFFVSNWMG